MDRQAFGPQLPTAKALFQRRAPIHHNVPARSDNRPRELVHSRWCRSTLASGSPPERDHARPALYAKPAAVKPVSKPIVKPDVKPVEKPVAKPPVKKGVHRVIVDGKQIGAYSDGANIIDEIRKALAKGAKKIEVNKV